LPNAEDLLAARGIDICYLTARNWWNTFGPMVAANVRSQWMSRMESLRQWHWNLDEVYAKINGGCCQSNFTVSSLDQNNDALSLALVTV
jgi:putative transposase